ncbi:MAG: nucleotidyltransferase family protein [Caldimonas sp.]
MALQRTVVVLAAGQGSRFQDGMHKLAQPLGDSSVLMATMGNALASGLHVVVVTTAAFADAARSSVAARDVVVLPEVGADPGGVELGMGSSIAAGVRASPDAAGWLVLPGDMPLVQPATLQAVARALDHHPVAFAQHTGRRGHPVGFAAELYSELSQLRGDEGARRLVARYPAYGIEIGDPGILVDIDTTSDLQAVRSGLPRTAHDVRS